MTSAEVDNKYKKHDLRAHIYSRPAMYIGPIEPNIIDTYIIDNSNKIIKKQISYIPGLFKIFDEALVNASDHKKRVDEIIKKQADEINELKRQIELLKSKLNENNFMDNIPQIPLDVLEQMKENKPELVDELKGQVDKGKDMVA